MAKREANSEGKGDTARKPLDASHRIVLLAGPELFLAGEFTAQLKEILAAAHGDIDTLHFDGTTAQVADVLDECRSFGLMQQHKLVVIDNADQLVKAENRPLIERYAQAPSETATLVLRATKWNKGKLDDMIEKVGAIKACEELPPAGAMKWAIGRCKKRHNKIISEEVAAELIDRTGCSFGRIDGELAKLAAAAGDAPEITLEMVDEMVGRRREEEVWGIQHVLLSGDAAASLVHLREMLDVSRHPAQLVGWAYTDLCRKLHGAAQGHALKMNPFAVTKALKLWGSSKDAVLSAGARLSPDAARRLYSAAIEADARGKSGLGEPERQIERLTVQIARAMRAR
ncbi:MAG: DNA polymerase III subunit delta [Planctomycetota bacterium]|nr:DNA polymerase III subunit delta [Planctomycetota bacterium]